MEEREIAGLQVYQRYCLNHNIATKLLSSLATYSMYGLTTMATKSHISWSINLPLIVGGSSEIQTLCHMTQVLLKLRFTAMERLTGY